VELFRITHKKYADSLTASGTANRWNREEEFVIYAGSSCSLCTLELIVHKARVSNRNDYKVLVISVADADHLVRQIKIDTLPTHWRQLKAYSQLQKLGSTWYRNMESLLLKVPSVVIPREYNYVINTKHPDFPKHVKLVRSEAYFWDERLVR